MRLLLFSGSLRKDSLNRKLLRNARDILDETKNNETQILDLKPLNIPVYDGDTESDGVPVGVSDFGEAISRADALVISTPEYNGSIAGPFKNAIDWLSRLRPVPLKGKPVLLLGASPSRFGAIRGLTDSRTPLEVLGSYVLPQTFPLSQAHEAFLETGELKDKETKERLASILKDFLKFSDSLHSKR